MYIVMNSNVSNVDIATCFCGGKVELVGRVLDSGGGCVAFESGREKGGQVVAWRNAHNVHSPIPDLLSPPHTFTCTHTTGCTC